MPQIFVFTVGNPEARQHLVDSIENPIDEKRVGLIRSNLRKRGRDRNSFEAYSSAHW